MNEDLSTSKMFRSNFFSEMRLRQLCCDFGTLADNPAVLCKAYGRIGVIGPSWLPRPQMSAVEMRVSGGQVDCGLFDVSVTDVTVT